MGTFYLYETWANRPGTRIHRANCRHCNSGRGAHGRGSTFPTGKWHGPYKTRASAAAAGRRLITDHHGSWAKVTDCKICRV